MNYLSVYTGGGGFEWFAKLMGWRCVGYVEQDLEAQEVIRARIRDGSFDDAPIWSDSRDFPGLRYRGKLGAILAGPPCQPDSHAGQLLGEADDRDGWPDTIRILREARPERAFLETVPGFFRSPRIWSIAAAIADVGYDLKWLPLSAFQCGADHERTRGWIMADSVRERSVYLPLPAPHTSAHDNQGFRPNGETRRDASWGSDYVSLQRMAYPGDIRAFDGLAGWSHRLRIAGNGICPRVAAGAFNLLS